MKKLYTLRNLVFLGLILVGLQSAGAVTYYSYTSGNWSDWHTWTLDPNGSLPPNGGIPQAGDDVVIRSSNDVTVDISNQSFGVVEVLGGLNMSNSSNITFSQLRGGGRVILSQDNYPLGAAGFDTHFITLAQGAGTVVLTGNSFTLSGNRTFCHLEVLMGADENSNQIASVIGNVTLNGNLNILQGRLQYNGASAQLFSVSGNVKIGNSASPNPLVGFVVGTSNVYHVLEVYGDFSNYGTVDFANKAQYLVQDQGAVVLKFKGNASKEFIIDGPTELYRLLVDKGANENTILSLNSSNTNYFKLMAPADGVITGDNEGGTSPWQKLPVVLLNGTLRLGNGIVIDRLGAISSATAPNATTIYDFLIPATARLWLNGATITTSNYAGTGSYGHGITVNGKLQMSAGSITIPANTPGISYSVAGEAASIIVESGTVFLSQIRPFAAATSELGFQLLGGTINFNRLAHPVNANAVLSMPKSTHSFVMNGGVMNFDNSNNAAATSRSIEIQAATSTVNGGTLNINLPALFSGTARSFGIETTVPFYNVNFNASGRGTGIASATMYSALTVKNDLLVSAGTTLIASTRDVTVGRHFTINPGGAFTHATSGTVKFNGSSNSNFINNNTTATTVFSLEVDKANATNMLYLQGSTGGFVVTGGLTLKKGGLDLNSYSVNVGGNIDVDQSVGFTRASNTGRLYLTGASSSIKGSAYPAQDFGIVYIGKSNSTLLTVLSDVKMYRLTVNSSTIIALGYHNLRVTDAFNGFGTNGGWGASRMVTTAGVPSCGGLTIPVKFNNVSGNQRDTIPVGNATSGYSPVYIDVNTSLTYAGLITVKPVIGEHPSLGTSGFRLAYYWNVAHEPADAGNTLNSNLVRFRFLKPTSVNIPGSANNFAVYENYKWYDRSNTQTEKDATGFYSKAYYTSGAGLTGVSGDFTLVQNVNGDDVKVLYSRKTGRFNDINTWSETGHDGAPASRIPAPQDICIIGGDDVAKNHTVYVTALINVSFIEIMGMTEVVAGATTPPVLYVKNGTGGTVDVVRGKGKLVYIDNDNTLSNIFVGGTNPINLTGFLQNSEATLVFGGTGSYTLPNTGQFEILPNVTITGGGAKNLASVNLQVLGSLSVDSLTTVRTANGTVGINYDLNLTRGGKYEFNYANQSDLTVLGNINMDIDANNSLAILTGGATDRTHLLTLTGSLLQNGGTVDFFELSNRNKVDVSFVGTTSTQVTNTGTSAEFSRLALNKGSLANSVSFDGPFTLSGAANAAVKPLAINTGTCILNSSGISNIIINSGNFDFVLPITGALTVQNGASVRVTGNNTGMVLSGNLSVLNNGALNCNEGTNNYIYYTNANPIVTLGSTTAPATLLVGSHFGPADETSVVRFRAYNSGSVIKFGEKGAARTDKGVFEIATGSELTLNATTLAVGAQMPAASVAGLYLAHSTGTLSNNPVFLIGGGPTSQTVDIYAASPIRASITVNGANARMAGPLTLERQTSIIYSGSLTIENGFHFTTQGHSLTIGGNFTNNAGLAAFIAANNTTYFAYNGTQLLTGNTTFFDLVKSGTGTLTVSNANQLLIENDLSNVALTGIIAITTNNINVKRNVTNNGIINSSTNVNFLKFNGTAEQTLSGAGTISRIEIDNNNGVVLNGNLSITGQLYLTNGVFNIGSNLLEFSTLANIITSSSSVFSATRMVQTSGSADDQGIKKVLTGNQLFEFPMGVAGKYTPVTLHVTGQAGATGRFVQIRPANEFHPTAILPVTNLLKYYWVVKSSGYTSLTGSLKFYYDAADVVGNINEYQTAVVDDNGNWRKNSGTVGVNPNVLDFVLTAQPSNRIQGHYTAGHPDALPNIVESFVTVADGNWVTDAQTVWATYTYDEDTDNWVTGTAGVGVPSGGPSGNIVHIKHNVTRSTNQMSSFKTTIYAGGILNIGSTLAHRLGDVAGTGTLIALSSGKLPAGNFYDFFSAGGGTLQLEGTTGTAVTPQQMDFGTRFNNLVLTTGTGTSSYYRTINSNWVINGKLELISVGNFYLRHSSNPIVSVYGDIQIIGAGVRYDPSNGTLLMAGETAMQRVYGNSNLFTPYNLEISNAHGVESELAALTVSNQLILSEGVLNTSVSDNRVIKVANSSISNAIHRADGSYVNGILSWNLSGTDEYLFPVGGSDGRYGPIKLSGSSRNGYWDIYYKNNRPSVDGLTESVTSPLEFLSENEYWSVKGPSTGASTALLKLRWDAQSDVFVGANLSVARLAAADASWTELERNEPVFGSTNSGGEVAISTPLSFSPSPYKNYVTFASKGYPDYTWLGALGVNGSTDWQTLANWSTNAVPGSSTETRIAKLAGRSQPVVQGNEKIQTGKLTILQNASITLEKGAQLTVSGDFVNNGLLEMKSQVDNFATFIATGAATGTGSVKYNMDIQVGRYWLHAYPLSNITAAIHPVASNPDVFLYKYNRASGWVPIISNTESLSTHPMKGYSGYFKGTGSVRTISFTGGINNDASYSYNATQTSWDLVANPYLSYIDLRTGISYANVYRTVYIQRVLEGGTRQWVTYNAALPDNEFAGTNGGTKYISPMQAFWVKWWTPGNFTINSTSRLHTPAGGGSLKSASTGTVNYALRLHLSDGKIADEALVLFADFGSDNYSTVYDSDKRAEVATNALNFYSVKQSQMLALNSLPDTDITSKVVPLGIYVGSLRAGSLTIKATNITSFMPDMDVLLLDKVTGETTSLRSKPEYTFTSSAVNNQNRFELSFKPIEEVPDVPTGTETANADNIVITAIGIGNKCIVKVKDPLFAGKVSIEVLDALGRVHSSVLSNTERTEVPAPTNTQFYVVKVSYKNMVKSFKVMNVMN
jgi:hypothetical protein